MKVRVARDPDDSRTDEVEVTALSQPRWSLFTGGSRKMLDRWSLFAYVICEEVPNVAHWGEHGECPHRVKVHVSEGGSDPAAYESLVKAAGVRPTSQPTATDKRLYGMSRSLLPAILDALEEKRLHSTPTRFKELMERVQRIACEMEELLETYIPSAGHGSSPTSQS